MNKLWARNEKHVRIYENTRLMDDCEGKTPIRHVYPPTLQFTCKLDLPICFKMTKSMCLRALIRWIYQVLVTYIY